jgi:heat-inducible transcriptional repressor
VGLPFGDLLGSLERRMLGESDSFYHLVKRSLNILKHALSTEPSERLFLDGMSHVVSQPEFSRDPRQAHQLLKGLDDQEPLLQRLREDLAEAGVRVRIGRELRVPGLESCSYVAIPFAIGDEIVGGIGVLGPTRMDYPRVTTMVGRMAQAVSRAFQEGR